MSKLSKVIVTLVIIAVYVVVNVLFFIASTQAGRSHTPGLIGMILLLGMIAALRAVWKKDRDGGESTDIKRR